MAESDIEGDKDVQDGLRQLLASEAVIAKARQLTIRSAARVSGFLAAVAAMCWWPGIAWPAAIAFAALSLGETIRELVQARLDRRGGQA